MDNPIFLYAGTGILAFLILFILWEIVRWFRYHNYRINGGAVAASPDMSAFPSRPSMRKAYRHVILVGDPSDPQAVTLLTEEKLSPQDYPRPEEFTYFPESVYGTTAGIRSSQVICIVFNDPISFDSSRVG